MAKCAIPLKPCQSSNILAHGYDEAKGVLAVQFKNAVYEYAGVPPKLYEELCGSPSIGQFFQGRVRGKFDSTKMVDEEDGSQ